MIIAAFKNGSKVYTKAAHQFDKGQKLLITGIALPETFEVHISNDPERGIASAYQGTAEGVMIPDAYFVNGDYIYIWLYAIEKTVDTESVPYSYQMGEDDTLEMVPTSEGQISMASDEGTSVYEIVIPIIRRPIQLPVAPVSGEVIGYTIEDDVLIPVRP